MGALNVWNNMVGSVIEVFPSPLYKLNLITETVGNCTVSILCSFEI